MKKKIEKEWQESLTPEQYYICRQKGTEPAFSGEYWDCKTPGMYHCTCCGAELFSSENKFDSGTGWPSFTQAAEKNSITEQADNSHGMQRTEIICSHCGAHLGHMFPDGPAPSGLRYCINSAALKLKTKK